MPKSNDITGQRFGRLVAIRLMYKHKNPPSIWECKCDCGNVVEVDYRNLHKGRTRSCGCLHRETTIQNGKNSAKDITGQRFGRLVAIRRTDKQKNESVIWECKCDCGNVVEVRSTTLRNGNTKSCGCLHRETTIQNGKKTAKDITGQRFGRLIALYPSDKRSKYRNVIWKCKCDCGNEVEISLEYLRSVKNDFEKSCGCLVREKLIKLGKNIDIKKQFGIIENTSISNIKSQTHRKGSITGHRGVSYNKKTCKYEAYIGFQKKQYHLGLFYTLEEAIKAREKAEEQIYKPFIEWYEENYESNI